MSEKYETAETGGWSACLWLVMMVPGIIAAELVVWGWLLPLVR